MLFRSELAFEDYKAGTKYADIAAKYGVSLSTVQRWATRYWKAVVDKPPKPPKTVKNKDTKGAKTTKARKPKWTPEQAAKDAMQRDVPITKSAFATKEERALAKKLKRRVPPELKKNPGPPYGSQNAKGNTGGKGGPYGNQNGKGHGAPYRSHNALKTGEYATIWLDMLSDKEQTLMDSISPDPLAQYDEEIKLLTIRERRMLDNIRDLKEKESALVEVTVAVSENGSAQQKMQTKPRKLLTDKLVAAEDALTRVQEKKLRAIGEKHRIMKELGRYENGDVTQVSVMRDMTEEELRNLAKLAGEDNRQPGEG